MRTRLVCAVVAMAIGACLDDEPNGCRYSSAPNEVGTVTVTSVSDPVVEYGQTVRHIGVVGLIDDTLSMDEGEYQRCFVGMGYSVGIELPAAITYGGGCPPEVLLGDCIAHY